MGFPSGPDLSPPINQKRNKRWGLRNRSHSEVIETTSPAARAVFQPNQTKICEEETKDIEKRESMVVSITNNKIGNISLKITNRIDASKEHIDTTQAFQMSQPPSKELTGPIDPDDSLLSQETAPESESDEDMNNSRTSANEEEEDSSSQDSASSAFSKRTSVRFADEIGLPIQNILRYECDRKQREHSELLVLCMSPEHKKFEFLHVGYHRHEDTNCHTVRDLLHALPGMCTDDVFSKEKFVALYRNNGVDQFFVNLCSLRKNDQKNQSKSKSNYEEPSLLLRECGFRENELIVAAIHGSSERSVLAGIGPVLSNEKIRKTLKRARRSRRGLKFIGGEDAEDDEDSIGGHSAQRQQPQSLRRRQRKTEENNGKPAERPKENASGCGELLDVDEYCDDYDPIRDVADFCKQLSVGIIVVCLGTFIFSAVGF